MASDRRLCGVLEALHFQMKTITQMTAVPLPVRQECTRLAVSGDIGARKDQLPPAAQAHRQPHQEFVPRADIDELYLNNPYYIVPDGEVGQQAFAVIREVIRKEGMVALGKVVFTSREHVIALEARGKGLMGVTLRYPYEVRNEKDYFDDIEDEKVPKDMLELASHIVDTKRGEFDPSKFEDRYEDALKDLLRKKQKGEKIERPKEPRPSNVVDLMEALRQSVSAEKGDGSDRRKSAANGRAHHRPAKKAGRTAARHRKAS
jgi:DNA end-binding protein Ku